MKDLVVGDIHATPDELNDCEDLMELVERTADEEDVDRIVFLGDLHHTFAVTNVKVVAFYRRWFKLLRNVVAIVGNHDMPGNGSQYPHALIAYEDLIRVVHKPSTLEGVLFLPYYSNPNLFHEAVEGNLAESKLIYCHQEFDGAMYDNGFYAPHGANPDMPVNTISGHIHTPQRVGGMVWYPGSPRWRTLSDANIDRHIWVHDLGNLALGVPTGPHLKRIWSNRLVEGEEGTEIPSANDRDEFRFYIEGSPEYVQNNAMLVRQNWPRCRVTTNIKNKTIRVRESDGIEVAFKKFASSYKAKNATPPETLFEKAKERVYGAN